MVEERGPAEFETAQDAQALLSAAIEGDADAIRRLVANGASADACDLYGEPAVHLAARFARLDALRALIACGADVHRGGPVGQTLLLCMAPYPAVHAALDEVIGRGLEVDAGDRRGRTPMMAAANAGCCAGVQAMLVRGADPQRRDLDGSNVLRILVRGSTFEIGRGRGQDALELMGELLQCGVDALQLGEFGDSAVTAAARSGLLPVLKLFARHLDVAAARDSRGRSASEVAATAGHAEAARFLIQVGAPCGVTTAAGLGDLVQLRRALDTSPRTLVDDQALAAALGNGHVDAALLLLAQGADANGACPEISMLHAAIRHCPDLRVIRALLAAGAKLEAADGDNNTPLNYAAREDQVAVAELLLQAGANPLAETERGYTAAEFARSDAMLQLLARHGCRRRT
jgi:ankyrin repeat protein